MPPDQRDPRSPAERAADHAAIDRLTEELVPALIVKLSATGLGEIEVAEDGWAIRVRRPGDGVAGQARRATDRASRAQPGHAGHGHGPAGFEGHRSAREAKAGAAANSSNGTGPGAHDAPADGGSARDGGADAHRVVATSPAVGVFQLRSDVKPGSRVRSGDRIGAVDMLGVPQEVIAPADGILGASLVEAGQAVEYGQELVVIELAARPAERSEG